jgi:hypothetical protein
MSLENLSKIGQLEPHSTDVSQVGKMLIAAAGGIADAKITTISLDTRFDAAYRAITQLSMVALWANGYRPSRSRPGHHQTMIQSLIYSINLDTDQMRLLDTMRVKRNGLNYSGEDMDEASVDACVKAADLLLQHLRDWLGNNRPELLK